MLTPTPMPRLFDVRFTSRSAQALQTGVSLIIVLIMLVIIGLTSAAAMRNATSGEKVTNNIRLQNLAQQYAEAALRYCEAEMLKASADRVPTLADLNISTTPAGTADALTGWGQAASWCCRVGRQLSL